MGWIQDLTFRMRSLGHRQGQEQELDDELKFHLEMEIERRMATGENRGQASRAARLDFGAPESVKEQCRDAWGVRLVEETRRDLTNAMRLLVKSPGFSTVAVGSLAVGLGVATLIFSLADAVLLQPLPFHDPSSLVSLEEVTPAGRLFSCSEPNLLDFEHSSQSLIGAAARSFTAPRPALQVDGARLRLEGEAVTPSFFSVLGVEARLGRAFVPSEGAAGQAPRVVVLSDRGWRRHFSADPKVIGRKIDLDGEMWTVVGVMAKDFRFRSPVDIFLPYVLDPNKPRGDRRMEAFARLQEGVSLEQASEEIAAIAAGLEEKFPESNGDWGIHLKPFDRFLLGEDVRQTHWVLLGSAGLLLLLACANVSNLLLARAADRGDETQLRLTLGASRARIRRQFMTEAMMLGVLGGAGGLLLASLSMPWVRSLDVSLPRLDQMSLSGRSFAFLALATLAASLIFGSATSLRSTAVNAAGSWRARRQGSGVASNRLRAGLVISEVALAMVLTVGAGLLLRSFEQLRGVDSGFETSSSLLLAHIDLPTERYPEGEEKTRFFFDRLIERLQELPTVEAVGASMVSPFRGPWTQNVVALETETELSSFTPISWRSVTSDYFQAMGVPLVRGRSIGPNSHRHLETVISASLADLLWPGQDPIGERLRWRVPDGPLLEVVGVVADMQDLELGGAMRPTVYWSQRAMGWQSMTVVVRTDQALEPLSAALREAVGEMDPLLGSPELSTLFEQREEALARPLLSLKLVALSALISLLMAGAGVYGMVAYAVSQRRREMGVRMAIGARPAQLVGMVIRDGAWLVIGGLVCGLGISLGLVGTLRLMLYQTSPFDPQVLAAVAFVLCLVGVVASGIPALRAGRVDPVMALRAD